MHWIHFMTFKRLSCCAINETVLQKIWIQRQKLTSLKKWSIHYFSHVINMSPELLYFLERELIVDIHEVSNNKNIWVTWHHTAHG